MVPFADLSFQWREIRAEVEPELQELFAKSAFCLGPWVQKFEQSFAEYVGTKHVIAVNSGTSALHIALIAAGLKSGDKIAVPAQTFIATVWGPLYVGGQPILCDVDETTGTLDPGKLEEAFEKHPDIRAVLPVHLFGQPAKMSAIAAIADRHGAIIIEDAAQSHGAQFEGRSTGSIGKAGCFSFYPGKNLGAAGEGGAVTTDDDVMAKRLRALRDHGQSERYTHKEIGYNYRMEGIQGLILDRKLAHLPRWTERRKEIANRYRDGLADIDQLRVPQIANSDHVAHLFVIRVPDRDALREHLTSRDIQTSLHYPIPLHRQPCLSGYGFDQSAYPIADDWAHNGLTLPVYYGMTDEQADEVISAVRGYYA